MFAKTLALAAAALLATTASAETRPAPGEEVIPATYQPTTKRFCVRTDDLREAERAGNWTARRHCLNKQQWRERGITFVTPRPGEELARL